MTAAAAPAFAASPSSCRTAYLDWGTATSTKLTNGTVYTITGTQTVYAQVAYTESAGAYSTSSNSTANYQLRIGKRAFGEVGQSWGRITVSEYGIATTGGYNDLILDQRSGSGASTVTIKFFSDAALTKPVYVNDLQVPLDDFSTQRTFPSLTFDPTISYQEMWSVSGTSTSGSITPTKTALTSPYNSTSTLANVAGSGTLADPWNFPVSLTNTSRNQVGGNLQTRFSQPVSSVTVTYGSNSSMSGPQGAGLGRLTMCV